LNLLDQENKQRLESALQTRRSDTGNGTRSQS
uniref:Transcriptional regulator n=1 Tax=Anisakis simplex TaxID=6269 RepID=A0A0M3JAE5_ANISI